MAGRKGALTLEQRQDVARMVAAARAGKVPWKVLEADLGMSRRQLSRYLRGARRVPDAANAGAWDAGGNGQEGTR